MQRVGLSLALAVLLGVGCSLGRASPKYWLSSQRREQIEAAAEAYSADLRWGRLEQAAAHVLPSRRGAFLELFRDPAQAPRFTGWEVMDVQLGKERGVANVVVGFQLYRPPAIREGQILEQQVWRYEPSVALWYVEPDLGLYRGEVGAR